MNTLQIHVSSFITFMLFDAIKDVLPSLITLRGKKIQENETTFYQLNCSSVWNPLGKSAEFIVNRKTVDHLSVFNDTCSNSEGKECNVNVISNCYCIPDKNIFIIKLKERSIDENIFSCQMRFKDARNENIIRAIVSIAFNGSEDELYEYDVKLIGNKREDENKNITNFKEHSENLEVWLPVGFSIGLIAFPILAILLCFCQSKYCRKSAETTPESPEELSMKTLEPLIDTKLDDELSMKTSKPLIDTKLDDEVQNKYIVFPMVISKNYKYIEEPCTSEEQLSLELTIRRTERQNVRQDEHEKVLKNQDKYDRLNAQVKIRKEVFEIIKDLHSTIGNHQMDENIHEDLDMDPTEFLLELYDDRRKKIIMSLDQGELNLDLSHDERSHVRDKFGKTPLINIVDLLERERYYTDYSEDADLFGNTIVHWACAAKENKMIQLIIKTCCDINKPNHYKVSPLMVACSKGHLTAAELLLKAGADYNAKDIHDTTVFHCACAGGNIDMIDLLIEQGCDIHKPNKSGITPLMVACSKSHLLIVQRLIEKNANVNENDLQSNSVFFWACTGGDIKVIKLLIKKNYEINKPNDCKITPLMVACLHGNFQIYQLLIDNGAEHNAIDAMGDTVFHYSCAGGNNDIIDSLIKKGCEIDKPNNSMITPLMVACGKGNLSAVMRLILSGANYNACDLKGRTVLHWSFASGNNVISELIVAVSDEKFPYDNLKLKVMNLITVAHPHVKETDFRDLIGTSQLYWSCVGNLPF